MGTVKVTNIEPIADNGTITFGSSGDTLALAAGATMSGFGKIGQMQFGTITANNSTTSTTFVDSGLTFNITPSSTSSKILVFAIFRGYNNSASAEIGYRILRDSTNVNAGRSIYNGGNDTATMQMFMAIDEPSSTSQLTYKLQHKSEAGSAQSIVIGGTADGLEPIAYFVGLEILD